MWEGGLKRKSTLLGVVTVLFWLSFLAYLPPTRLTAEHKELVAEAREARKVVSLVASYPHIGQRLHFLFLVILPKWPVYVIHNDVVATVFYIGTTVMLLRAWSPNNALQRTGSAGR